MPPCPTERRLQQTKAQELGLADRLTAAQHDVRERFPFAGDSFDACYSHMLFCMAFTDRHSREPQGTAAADTPLPGPNRGPLVSGQAGDILTLLGKMVEAPGIETY